MPESCSTFRRRKGSNKYAVQAHTTPVLKKKVLPFSLRERGPCGYVRGVCSGAGSPSVVSIRGRSRSPPVDGTIA